MKKIICFALAALACSCSSGNFTINGKLEGITAGDSLVIYSYFDSNKRLAACAVMADGTFSFKGSVDQTTTGALVLNNSSMITPIFLEGGKVTISVNESGELKIQGGELNNSFSSYIVETNLIEQKFRSVDPSLPEAELQAAQDVVYGEYLEYVESVVDENLDNLLGAFLFSNEEINRFKSATEALERVDAFSTEIKEQPFMIEIRESISAMLRTETGQQYTDIKLNSVDGTAIAVSDLLADGKYVLIDFWATWCSPCVSELPYLKEAYAEFKDKNFEIYGVSLDQNIEDWSDMVDQNMPWVNVIDNESVVAADLYAIRNIPANFLISPSGEIIAKNLRGEDLATILKEHIQ
ncbi:MAG: TlpA disulfide reductase family protein [Rikenellaceae bacterium]